MTKPKVAVIGAGPCGIFAAKTISEVAEVTVLERANIFGGQWAFAEDDLDEKERTHSSQYSCLWINSAKESFEMPNFHFPENTPSYIKRPVVYKYLQDYMDKFNVHLMIKYRCHVDNVTFNEAEKSFTVDFTEKEDKKSEMFDYVVVATGHFSWPNDPKFKGEETFPGKVIHAHAYQDGKLYKEISLYWRGSIRNMFLNIDNKDKRVLCIGGSYSAEDIALQCWKFGSKCAHITHRNAKPMGFDWPEGILERPILTDINGSTVTFADGSSEDYDVIVKCTGYLHYFPFMSDAVKLSTKNRLAPDGLYKQCVLINNPRTFYLGMQNQFFTFSMFQLQGWFVRDVISGKHVLPEKEQMIEQNKTDQTTEDNLKAVYDAIGRGSYCDMLAEETGQEKCNSSEMLIEWCRHKDENILTYRDQRFKNLFTGKLGEPNTIRWIDDLEA